MWAFWQSITWHNSMSHLKRPDLGPCKFYFFHKTKIPIENKKVSAMNKIKGLAFRQLMAIPKEDTFESWKDKRISVWGPKRSTFIIMAFQQHGFLWLSLTIHLYRPLHLVSPLDGTQYPQRADECKFLLVGQHICVYVQEPLGENCLWLHHYFTSRFFYLDVLCDGI